jgi:hypothetical protein
MQAYIDIESILYGDFSEMFTLNGSYIEELFLSNISLLQLLYDDEVKTWLD